MTEAVEDQRIRGDVGPRIGPGAVAVGTIVWTFLIGLATTGVPAPDSRDAIDGLDSWFAVSGVPFAVATWVLARRARDFAEVLVAVPATVVLQDLALDFGLFLGTASVWGDAVVGVSMDLSSTSYWARIAAISTALGLAWTAWHGRFPTTSTVVAATASATAALALAWLGLVEDRRVAPALIIAAMAGVVLWLDRGALRRQPVAAVLAAAAVIGATQWLQP